MNKNLLEARLITSLTDAYARTSAVALHRMRWANWTLLDSEEPPQYLIDDDETLLKPFEQLTDSIYLTTLALLEVVNMPILIDQFKHIFGPTLGAQPTRTIFEVDTETDEYYSPFLTDLSRFLASIGISTDAEAYYAQAGVKYLENILNNTAMIIHNSGNAVSSEAQVYNSVKQVIEAVFPDTAKPRSNFIKLAQEYKPDILIPSIATAVEYKYATTPEKLKATIGQIAEDVLGYTGDDDYRLFYAVFYVTDDLIGKERFNAIWEEKNFPQNWKALYIVGR